MEMKVIFSLIVLKFLPENILPLSYNTTVFGQLWNWVINGSINGIILRNYKHYNIKFTTICLKIFTLCLKYIFHHRMASLNVMMKPLYGETWQYSKSKRKSPNQLSLIRYCKIVTKNQYIIKLWPELTSSALYH